MLQQENYVGFFINKEILAIHLINYIDLNNSLHPVSNFNRPNHKKNSIAIYLIMSMDGPNLSTPIQVVVALVHECNRI
jgi:hypothetical protein